MLNDLKFAFRQLLKNPGSTAIAIITLALGIGATTAICSVLNTVVLNPVPGPDWDQVMQIAKRNYDTRDNTPRLWGVSSLVLEALRHE